MASIMANNNSIQFFQDFSSLDLGRC